MMNDDLYIYRKFPQLYDSLYGADDKDSLGFVKWILNWLEISKNDPILDVGSGTGNILLPLLQEGYTVSGLEPFQGMIEQALTKAEQLDNIRPDIELGGIEDFESDMQYGMILAINGPIHYIEPEDIQLVFNKVYRLLEPNGYFLIDLINFYSILKSYDHPEPMEFEIEDVQFFASVHHDVDLDLEIWTNKAVIFYKDETSWGRINDYQPLNMYNRRELVNQAKQAGLELQYFFSSYADRPTKRSYGSRLILLFKK